MLENVMLVSLSTTAHDILYCCIHCHRVLPLLPTMSRGTAVALPVPWQNVMCTPPESTDSLPFHIHHPTACAARQVLHVPTPQCRTSRIDALRTYCLIFSSSSGRLLVLMSLAAVRSLWVSQ
jgi:hypothetical protein